MCIRKTRCTRGVRVVYSDENEACSKSETNFVCDRIVYVYEYIS